MIDLIISCISYTLQLGSATVTTIAFVRTVLPYGLDVTIVGVAAYYLSKLSRPSADNVNSIFGPAHGTPDAEIFPEKVAQCIAHRGASLDAPENTMEALKYCINNNCNFVEIDVRTCKDGRLVLLHDPGLQRVAGSDISDIHIMDWEAIKEIEIGNSHPDKETYRGVHLCLLDEALDYLLEHKASIILDVKGNDSMVIDGVLDTYKARPELYKRAAVTCFNPFVLYQIRRRDPKIVGAMSYRPYCFSAEDYDAETGPRNPRSGSQLAQLGLRALDAAHAATWRAWARWCGVSCVLLHKDAASPAEVSYWRALSVRCCGWCVNAPMEKAYWRRVLRSPYLANTLVGEADLVVERGKSKQTEMDFEKLRSDKSN